MKSKITGDNGEKREGKTAWRRLRIELLLGFSILAAALALHATPVISNVTAVQRPSTDPHPKWVDISYTIFDPDATSVNVSVRVSLDSGVTWTVPANTFPAAYGSEVGVNVPVTATATTKTFSWDAGTDWDGHFTTHCRVRVVVNDSGLVLIPAGSYSRGDSLDGETDAPVYSVYVSAFLMDRNLVTGVQWNIVVDWANSESLGYAFAHVGSYKGLNHPVQTVDWFDAVKWCNARSEKEGLTPVYYTGSTFAWIYRYRAGEGVPVANPAANGYRLPTEAEWEKAARGGLSGKRFPWGDTIRNGPAGSGGQANYFSGGGFSYDLGPTGFNSAYNDGMQPYTSPVGSFAANGYGLYDMAGNVLEWCYDWYGDFYYVPGQTDPQGPSLLGDRVLRGGSWGSYAGSARCADRNYSTPTLADDAVGFRCVRGL